VITRKLLIRLIFVALGLPVVMVVIGTTSALLSSMGDTVGSKVLCYIVLATGILWVVNLVILVVAQAVRTVEDNLEDDDSDLPLE
jgi:hypothetical protein